MLLLGCGGGAVALLCLAVCGWTWVMRRRFRRADWKTPRLGLAVVCLGGNRPLPALVGAWERDLEMAWVGRLKLGELQAITQRLRVVCIPCEGLRPLGARLAGLDDGLTAVVGYREVRDCDDNVRPDWPFTRSMFLHEISHAIAASVLGHRDAGAHHALFREIKLGA